MSGQELATAMQHGLVTRTADFEAAFERALAAGRPALLELPVAASGGPPD